MIAFTAIGSIIVFIFALRISGVVQVGHRVLATVRGAVAVMRDDSLDDEIREKKLQRASLQLFGAFISMLIRSAFVFLASLLSILLASLVGLAEIEDVIFLRSRQIVLHNK